MIKFNKNNKIKYSYDKGIDDFTEPIPTSLDDWNKSEYNDLKKHIKKHYSIIQDDKCAYCREEMRFEGYGEPIEHIIPKSKKIEWMFHPQNLCLACYGCNTKKGVKNPLIEDINTYISFPDNSSDYKIVHPHFDVLSTHIKEENFYFKSRNASLKGKETIKMCDLNRFDLLYKRIRRKKRKPNFISFLTMTLLTSTDEKEIKLVQELLKRLIERNNYKMKLEEK